VDRTSRSHARLEVKGIASGLVVETLENHRRVRSFWSTPQRVGYRRLRVGSPHPCLFNCCRIRHDTIINRGGPALGTKKSKHNT
jgi:hypothetical protein